MEFLNAIARNDIDKVRQLIQNGIDVNSSFLWNSKDTYSPVLTQQNNYNIGQQEYQCKGLNIAVLGGYSNMVRLLLSAGADINNKDGRGRTALICAIYGIDLDASNINTSNLHLISQTNSSHFDIMKNILLCHPNLYYATLDAPQYEIKGITPLSLASYLGKSDIIQLLLEDGRVNVDGTDSKNATALMYAARDGNVPIVKMLLKYHASPDITDTHGWSAIQYAEKNPEIVQLCEQVLRIKRSELNIYTAYHTTNYTKLSHLLNTIPSYPSSLSHLEFNTLKEINHLDPSASHLVNIIQSAFLQAIKIHDHLSLQTLLMKSSQVDNYGPLLINYHDPKTGLTAIHHAMRTKPLPSLDTITMLFQAGIDMNAQTYYGRTALHHLARFGLDKDGLWGIQKTNTNTTGAHSLIEGVPQHLAMCTSLLIKFGALVNIPDPTGNTPLHFAVEFGGVIEVIEVFVLEGNADLSIKNKKGSTVFDVCKSDEIKRRLFQLEVERRQSKTKSMISSISGTIRPFDSASEYKSATIKKSLILKIKDRKVLIQQQKKQLQNSSNEYTDFEIILQAFFSYQTIFTDSIESSLAFITDSILIKHDWQQLKNITSTLRIDLREANEVFDTTGQLIEKVMVSFRQELEQVEQVHQADWELSELQHDKIEKLFDVFERIDGRFNQLEFAQQDLVSQIEKIKKCIHHVSQQQVTEEAVDVNDCVLQLSQTICILEIMPVLGHLKQDENNKLYQDIQSLMDQVASYHNLDTLLVRWNNVKVRKAPPMIQHHSNQLARSKSHANMTENYHSNEMKSTMLNQLELNFDILYSNLFEIQKDINQVTDHLDKLNATKKSLYESCLQLEKELETKLRPEQDIKQELNQVLLFTQKLLDKQEALNSERNQLTKEHQLIETQLNDIKESLQKVRPPLLLQGLLDRLETSNQPMVIVEKDWKEDTDLVNEIMMDMDPSEDDTAVDLSSIQQSQLLHQCASKLNMQCYLVRLDSSLYCLKVLATQLLNQSRQHLVQVQTSLAQASNDLDETRNHMTQLYDDAAEVARQVFSLKIELETIVRHRKEEVVKVWEVVDEVSESINSNEIQNTSSTTVSTNDGNMKEKLVEEQDRHQWIIRELEQLQYVYDSLQDAIEQLKHEQALIGQSLRQLASNFIEPQVDILVGPNDHSLLTVSDKLAELMNCIRKGDLGLNVSVKEEEALDHTGSTITSSSTTTHTSSTITNTKTLNRLSMASSHHSSYDTKPMSSAIRSDKKRMSIISATSLSSLSSYQQERMMAKASNLSQILLRHKK